MVHMVPNGPVSPCMILYGPVWYSMVRYSLARSRMVPLFWPKMLSCLTKEQILTLLNFVCLCSTHATSAQILCLLNVSFSFRWYLGTLHYRKILTLNLEFCQEIFDATNISKYYKFLLLTIFINFYLQKNILLLYKSAICQIFQ